MITYKRSNLSDMMNCIQFTLEIDVDRNDFEVKNDKIIIPDLTMHKERAEAFHDRLMDIGDYMIWGGVVDRPSYRQKLKEKDARIAALEQALTKARNELASMVPNPDKPDFGLCLTRGTDFDEADEECLMNAYKYLTGALENCDR